MKIKTLASLAVVICLANLIIWGGFTKTNANKLPDDNVPESIIYSQVFILVANFNQKAENETVESEREFFHTYFRKEALLSYEQNQVLLTAAENYSDAFSKTSGEQKLNLSLQYKDELRKQFGASEFKRFDEFVRKNIAPGTQFFQSDGFTFSGQSGIFIDQTNQVLRGTSTTTIYTDKPEGSQCPGAVSAVMTGANVSVSGNSNICNPNPTVELTSTTYQQNSQYCIDGTHTYNSQSLVSRACLMPEPDGIVRVWYEQIANDDLAIDTNPNTPNCAEVDSSAGCGQRIFSDDKVPLDGTDRRKIRVKAKYNGVALGLRIYFRSFDVDDPSANAAPIDPNGSLGDDNNGLVDGTANTKNGKFSIPQPNPQNCALFAGGISCEVNNNTGIATAEFITTMQPGDNFTVVAGTNETYIKNNIMLAADGINLKDTNNVQIPVSATTTNTCLGSSVGACRANMLTVWRRLHLEVDSMGNVGIVNRVTGTINGNVTIPGRGNSLNPGVGTVNINTPPTLELQRFDFGRLVVGNHSFLVKTNTSNSLTVANTETRSVTLNNNSNFILYDDDDYNYDDSQIQTLTLGSYSVDGDENEAVICLPDSLIYLSDESQTCSNGTPQNMYAPAYIKPEYDWAQNVANFNQTNLQFELNVEYGTNNATVINVIDRNRNSKNTEKDDFWIGYVLLGYQGPLLEDSDGISPNGGNEKALQGASPNIWMSSSEIPSCDCYMSNVCPSGGVVCNLNGTPILPRGSFGSVIFQEVNQDLKTYFLLLQTPYTARTIEDIKLTIPHEIGHQFGLLGDQKRPTFKIMDYSDYIGNVVNDEFFHPEHINIMRRRIKSPGQ